MTQSADRISSYAYCHGCRGCSRTLRRSETRSRSPPAEGDRHPQDRGTSQNEDLPPISQIICALPTGSTCKFQHRTSPARGRRHAELQGKTWRAGASRTEPYRCDGGTNNNNATPTTTSSMPRPQQQAQCHSHNTKLNATPTTPSSMPRPQHQAQCHAHNIKLNAAPTTPSSTRSDMFT